MKRYQRQMSVEEIGRSGQKKIGDAHVAIIGVGGLGCPIGLYLAGAGVGKLTLVDHDTVSLTNLHRQVLFTERDVGQPKVEVACRRLLDLNQDIVVTVHPRQLNASNITCLLEDVDVVVDASDNFALSYLLSDFSCKYAKPLVSASVMQTNGYVGVYCFSTFTQKACPSLRAVFPNPPIPGQDCNSVGVIGVAAGMLGMLQAQEVLKVILADAQQLAGRLLTLNCWSYRQNIIDFNLAPEPDRMVKIISKDDIKEGDWVVDVRSSLEIERQPKQCHQQMPVSEFSIASLPQNKRLVFTCAVGQRALFVADQVLCRDFDNVAVWL